MSVTPPPPINEDDKQPNAQTVPPVETSTEANQNKPVDLIELPAIPFEKKQWLNQIDGGKTLKRLEYIHQKYLYIPPAEMYLLVNPTEIYTTALYHFSQKTRQVEKFRNILVLLPLCLTWIGLSIASTAYSQALFQQPKLIESPFLKLWIDGFPTVTHLNMGGILIAPAIVHFFAFSDVAIFDALLFIGLIGLTLWVQKSDALANDQAQELNSWLQEHLFMVERHSMIVHSEQNGRDLSLDRFSDRFADLMTEMQKVVTTFNGIVQQQMDGLVELIKGTTRIATAADRIDIIFVKGEETYTKLSNALVTLEEQFETMASRQSGIAESMDETAQGIHKAATAIDELARPFAAEDLGSLARKIGKQQQQSMSDFNQHLQKQAEIANVMNEVTGKISVLPIQPQTRNWFARLRNKIRAMRKKTD